VQFLGIRGDVKIPVGDLEALFAFPVRTMRVYIIIESGSQGCLDMMTDRAAEWEANNWHKLGGNPVQNQQLAERITAILTMFDIEFRKVKGHNNDEWNDLADKLAVEGRDEAGGLPRCAVGIQVATGTILFAERAMPSRISIPGLWLALQQDTSEILPPHEEYNLFKDNRSGSVSNMIEIGLSIWYEGFCTLFCLNRISAILPP
jgi:hypothetical protein